MSEILKDVCLLNYEMKNKLETGSRRVLVLLNFKESDTDTELIFFVPN